MRQIIVFDRVSADGYFAAPNGMLDWTVPEDALDKQAAANTSTEPGTLLFGRRTYDMFESFWPKVAAQPADDAPDPHTPGRASPDLRRMATFIDAATKIVISRSRSDVAWRNSRLLRDIVPAEIEALKAEPGSDIMIFGSGSVASRLTELGLIDAYHFVVGPVLLGSGKSLIRDITTRTSLTLLEATAYPSGNVLLRYAPKRA